MDREPAYRRQRGAGTLITALILLLMVTVVTFVSGRIAVTDQRLSANEQRTRQAFDAAQAGIDLALAYAQNGGTDQDADGTADTLVAPSAPQQLHLDPSDSTSQVVGSYAVEYCDPDLTAHPLPAATGACMAPSDTQDVLIYSRGWSDDQTAVHNITMELEGTPATAGPPANPLITRGSCVINGSGDVINPESSSTIWSGMAISFTNANFKTSIPSPSGAGLIETSNRYGLGVDVVDQDGNLSTLTEDQLFRNFFGVVPSIYKANFATTIVDTSSGGSMPADGSTNGELIWVDGDLSQTGNHTWGTATDPVVLIVRGNLSLGGDVTINGLVYVSGDLVQSGGGSVAINGAVVVYGDVDFSGNLTITYDSSILNKLSHLGQGAALNGTWKDWI